MATPSLPITGDPDADELLAGDPLALLIGMVLDQQIPMEKAFHSPYDLSTRLGTALDAHAIAAMDPDELGAVFSQKPALHRFPSTMARRVQDACRVIAEEYRGDASGLWKKSENADELFARLCGFPGFGEYKARMFIALLGKQFGITPEGWRTVAGPYGVEGTFVSVADIDSPEALSKVRAHKKMVKAAHKAET